MSEDDVVRFVREYIEGLFPKTCPRCGQVFKSLREYLLGTTHVGDPFFYHPISGAIPADPLGPLSHANCACGTTLTIGSQGIPPAQMVELLHWAKRTAAERSIEISELLRHIRDRIDAQVLGRGESAGHLDAG
jgi:hypothetical protein